MSAHRKYKPIRYREDLTAFRDRSGMTQKEIAEKLGIHRNTWQQYEYGLKKPRKYIQVRIDALMLLYPELPQTPTIPA